MPFRGRIAYPSYVDKTLFGNPHEFVVKRAATMPAGLKDQVVISSEELQTMAYRSRLGPAEASEKQVDRDRLHHLSNDRKAKWPNTIEANRERKEKLRLEKMDAEERLRLEIDRRRRRCRRRSAGWPSSAPTRCSTTRPTGSSRCTRS